MSEVIYYTARPEGSGFEYEMVMSTDYEVTAEDRDAQRLRADTAEAELDALRALLQRVIDSSVLSFEADAPEELESLEVDICAALNQKSEAESHDA